MKLTTNPVLIRELEMRARHPASYAGFRYEGIVQPLGIVSLTFLVLLILGWTAPLSPVLFELPLGGYTLYLAYASARLGGGSLASDRTYLSALPVSPVDIFLGKLIGSLLPLWTEVLMVAPILFVPCWLARVPLATFLEVVAFLQGVVLVYGIWGMFWSSLRPDVEEAVRMARRTVHLFVWGVAVFSFLLLVGGYQEAWQPWAALDPVFDMLLLIARSSDRSIDMVHCYGTLLFCGVLGPAVLSFLTIRRVARM